MATRSDIRALQQFGISRDAYNLALAQTGDHNYACHLLLLLAADDAHQTDQRVRIYRQIIHHREALNLSTDAYHRAIARLSGPH